MKNVTTESNWASTALADQRYVLSQLLDEGIDKSGIAGIEKGAPMTHPTTHPGRQRLIRGLTILLAADLFAAQAQGSINLITDKPIGTPLVMDAGTVSLGNTMIVSINSDAADGLLGWQTTLWILPTGGVGDVGFNQTFQPMNYVFGARQFYSEDLTFPANNDGMFAFDPNIAGGGMLLPPVVIPGPPGLNLNELDFVASAGASGLFGVFAVGGTGRSEWTDQSFNAVLFDNINPTPDSHTQIGEIFINAAPPVIPEPGTALLGVISLGILCVTWARRS